MPRTFSIYEDKENLVYNHGVKTQCSAPNDIISTLDDKRHVLADLGNVSFVKIKRKSFSKAEKKERSDFQKRRSSLRNTSEDAGSVISSVCIDPVKERLSSFEKCNRSNFGPKNPDKDSLEGFGDYRVDVYQYLRSREVHRIPKPYFIKKQPHITSDMRSILVDWLIEVALEYNLEDDTLYLAVGLVDRFLSRYCVKKNKLQLLGIASMFLAAKYETVYPPGCHNFSYITAHTYSVDQILSMETYILEGLSFNVLFPTIHTFLHHISLDIDLVEKIKNLSMFLCELILVQGDPYFEFSPSLIAAAAIAYSRNCIGFHDPWPPCLAKSTGYFIRDIRDVAHCIFTTHSNAPTLKERAAINKYSKFDHDNVSSIISKPFPVV